LLVGRRRAGTIVVERNPRHGRLRASIQLGFVSMMLLHHSSTGDAVRPWGADIYSFRLGRLERIVSRGRGTRAD
jgi:hypothetical protein